MWLRLDNSHYDGWEDVKKKFCLHIEQETNTGPPLRYMDRLAKTGHVVFVTNKTYKTFGIFTGSNARGKALVTFDNQPGEKSFEPSEVISM